MAAEKKMKTLTAATLMLIISGSFSAVNVSAADCARDHAWWFNFGAGANVHQISNHFWLAGTVGITKMRGHNLFSVRWLGTAEADGTLAEYPKPLQYAKDLSVMMGKVYQSRIVRANVSMGVGYVYGLKRGKWLGGEGNYNCEKLLYSTIGLPLEAQLTLKRNGQATALSLYANLNSQQSFVGLMLCLQIGR